MSTTGPTPTARAEQNPDRKKALMLADPEYARTIDISDPSFLIDRDATTSPAGYCARPTATGGR